jgi:hypothetical protein
MNALAIDTPLLKQGQVIFGDHDDRVAQNCTLSIEPNKILAGGVSEDRQLAAQYFVGRQAISILHPESVRNAGGAASAREPLLRYGWSLAG